jgi:predicted acetyltransferase
MKPETRPTAGVDVRPAAPGEEPVLANLLELYAHDFSALADLQLHPDGRYGYRELPLYWREATRFPFLVRVDGFLAGFALVTRGSRVSGDPDVWDMAEFFVVRRHRRRGIGAAAAHEVFRRFPGRWELRVMEHNLPALAFWSAAVGAFTGAPAEGVFTQVAEKRWQVFAFASPGSAA